MIFNKTHPELQDGEAFLINASTVERADEFQRDFKTVRMGELAYDAIGNICKDLNRSLFLSKN